MISVDEALQAIFALARPLGSETVGLRAAYGRVLAEDAVATRTQPPFASSAMDGYAIAEPARPGLRLAVIGESAAGKRFSGSFGPGQAVRIFTGAPVPDGTVQVVIQEDTAREGDTITLGDKLDRGTHIRPMGGDFTEGTRLAAGRRLGPGDLSLLAAMNCPELRVTRRPEVALIATGDELVMPGGTPGPDQIVASTAYALAALFEAEGAVARILPIARDRIEALEQAFDLARGADLVVTLGGASVGDHDLVSRVAASRGRLDFHKVAMRPGKPLMAGTLDGAVMLGLPGNPVSAMVCGLIFGVPLIRAMSGLPAEALPRLSGRLTGTLPANGPREHYMRARREAGGLRVLSNQDSSLLSALAEADALVVRPVGDPARDVGDAIEYVSLHGW